MACSRRGVFAEGALAVAQRVQQRDVDVLVVVLLGGVGLAQRENALYLTLSPHRHLHDPNAIHQQVLFALTVSTPRLSLEQPRVVHAQVQHHRSVSHTTPPPPLPRDLPTLLLLLAHLLALRQTEHARQLHQTHRQIALLLVQPVRPVARAPVQQELHQRLDVVLQRGDINRDVFGRGGRGLFRRGQEGDVFRLHHGYATREEFRDSALFRFVVGNVENDDLLRRGDNVVQVHVDRLLLREGSIVVLFVSTDSIIDVNVNGARGLVRFVQHGIVRLHDALR